MCIHTCTCGDQDMCFKEVILHHWQFNLLLSVKKTRSIHFSDNRIKDIQLKPLN